MSNGPNKPANSSQESWARPIAQRKDSQLRAWLISLGVLLLGVALWTPLRTLWTRHKYVRPETSVVRDATSFVALAFPGVSSDSMRMGLYDVPTLVFEEQIKELAARGYQAIDLADVRAFYKEGKLLPRRAILLTFEQTRKSSYFEARSILNRYAWKAVMGVWAKPIQQKDAQSLLWPYLRDMTKLGTWDLAAQSYDGFQAIPAGPNGEKSAFLSTPMWKSIQYRYEAPEEFISRVRGDHVKIITEMKNETGASPIAYFYPYGNYGQHDEEAHVVRETNLKLVDQNYACGFILGSLGLNTQYTDVARLNRLLVNPRWSAKELVDYVDQLQPFSVEQEQRVINFNANDWVQEWGGITNLEGDLVLRAVPGSNPLSVQNAEETSGAKVWLAGSDLFCDGFVSLRFKMRHGQFAVYLRCTSYGEYIAFTLDAAGRATIRQRTRGGNIVTLASDTVADEGISDCALLFGMRGNNIYVLLNKKMLFGGRVLAEGMPSAGLIGLSVWDATKGVASARVSSMKVILPNQTLVTWTPDVGRNSVHLASWLHENAYRFSLLAPPWLHVVSSASFTLPAWDVEMVDTIAKINATPVYPRILVSDASYLQALSQKDLLLEIKRAKGNGVFVDALDCQVSQMSMLSDWLLKLYNQPEMEGLKLIIRLPLAAESIPSTGNLMEQLKNALLVGDFTHPVLGLTWARQGIVLPVENESGGGPLELYYQINTSMSRSEETTEMKADRLRQSGFDAFAQGRYTDAITAWSEWSLLCPHLPSPHALKGDAYIRLKQFDDALESYTTSLAINPGQVDLALRRSRLLEKMGRKDEQAEQLNLYARTFPGVSSIVIEQAKWLRENKRLSEACTLLKKLVAERPDEIEARQILQGMLTDPLERYRNLSGFADMARKGNTSHFGFGRVLMNSDLLSIREAGVFFPLIRDIASTSTSRASRQLFQDFLPLDKLVYESFKTGKLSDDWISFGNSISSEVGGRFELRAGSDMAEAYLRLKRSDFMRDGFVSVNLDESVGFFWLYARRSADAMIRFGFDDEGFLRIQTWMNGDLVSSDFRAWLRPPGTVNIRLEIRGDGAHGYVNGGPAFSSGLGIANELRYGWWSVAPFAPDVGVARARIQSIACGPLPATILFVPPIAEPTILQLLDMIRPSVSQLTLLAPVMYVQRQNGAIEEDTQFKVNMLRMFAAFHRLRFVPVVDASFYSEVDVESLIQIIQTYNLSTLCLCTRSKPAEAWFRKMTEALEKTTATVFVISSQTAFWAADEKRFATVQNNGQRFDFSMQQIERGNVVFAPYRSQWSDLEAKPFTTNGIPPVIHFEDQAEVARFSAEQNVPALMTPRIYVFPSRGPIQSISHEPVSLTPPKEVAPLAKSRDLFQRILTNAVEAVR